MMNRAVIDEKKVKAIFKYIDTLNNSKQIRMMFMFSFNGMRSVNFRNLQLKDVLNDNDEVKDIIELGNDKNKGKNKAKYYVSDELKKEIEQYIKSYNLNNKEQYLFISHKTGKPYSRTYISTIFSNVYNTFGLDCSSHYGRRYLITNLLTKGVDITSVKTLVNHKNIATTSLYYNENENLLKSIMNDYNK